MKICFLPKSIAAVSLTVISALAVVAICFAATLSIAAQQDNLTPLQRKIEQQRQHLSSPDIEERRDALMKLGVLEVPEASRVAASALNDPEPIVRVTAARAIVSLPPAEASGLLIPLLKDKLEFVRREVAYALGRTRSRSAVAPLAELLSSDKEVGVRAAAVIALGQIKDESAVPDLIQVLSGTAVGKKSKARESEFVLRAAAQALGEIRSRAAVNVLIEILTNDLQPPDVRRSAANSLGLIGDPQAMPALQAAFASDDPYLSQAAHEAIRRLAGAKN